MQKPMIQEGETKPTELNVPPFGGLVLNPTQPGKPSWLYPKLSRAASFKILCLITPFHEFNQRCGVEF